MKIYFNIFLIFFQGVQRLVMHLVRESGGVGLHLEHRAGGEPPPGEGATHQQKPGVFIRHIEEGSPAHRYVCFFFVLLDQKHKTQI